MLRITASANAKAASTYHRDSLSKQGEYYKENVPAFYHGELAVRLGLHEVTEANFYALINNKHPETGDSLTPLNVEGRRVGWDLTILPPKSFSLLCAFTNDPELEKAFLESNREMMFEAQKLIVCQANSQTERFFEQSQNGCWAEFRHTLGRPVEMEIKGEKLFGGQPLQHIHNFLFNASYSPERDKILAVDPYFIYRAAPYLQSYFHNQLTNRLVKLGYGIERTKDAWEISGVSKSLVDRFSERSKIIENISKEKGITDPNEKAKLGAKSRVSKKKSIPENELYDVWRGQISDEEFRSLNQLKGKGNSQSKAINISEAIDKSLYHFLERNSVAEESRILAFAMKLTYGSGYSLDDFKKELLGRDNVIQGEVNHLSMVTTKVMIQAENHLIETAIAGKGKFRPLNPDHQISRDFLNSDQRQAVKEILSSSDQFIALEGKAGAGKSTMLQELHDGLKSVSVSMIPIAPSSQAVEVLRGEGFSEAQTIASFLINPKDHMKAKNGVLVVDEASLSGVKTMNDIFRVAKKQNARVVLSGNVAQLSSPGEYGDALRILQQQGIKTIHLKQNMRQKPEDYKRAVDLASRKDLMRSYQVLDQKMGAVVEVADYVERLDAISESYIQSISAKRSALIVSPTNAQKDKITALVREKLKAQGKIKGKERVFDTLKDLSLTNAQKQDVVNYSKGDMVRFVRNQTGGFKSGSHYEVMNLGKEGIQVQDVKTKQLLILPHQTPEHYTVNKKTKTEIGVGDFIKPTVNLKSVQNTKLNNGTPQVVKGFVGKDILLENGKTLRSDSFHFTHNYASTAHAAQGKTCQDVFVDMSAETLGAVNEQSYYVSVSRGRSQIKLFTDDKKALKAAIGRSGERTTARELAKQHQHRLMTQKQRQFYHDHSKLIEKNALSRQRQKEPTRDISA